jgi:hypothetical protein
MYSAPLLPSLAVPELKTRRPLTPDTPLFAVLMKMDPLVDAVPSPDKMASAPPVWTVLVPESSMRSPPEPLVPEPTVK